MKKFFRRCLDWFVFVLTGKGQIANEAVNNNLVDIGGQGRDKYGR